MQKPMKYVLGLDIGIGSVGWAVIRCERKARIENFGVRIFDSGENEKRKSRASQKRRMYRSRRRLARRRAHRKERLRFWFQKQGLATIREVCEYFDGITCDPITLRVRALDEKISPVELVACMIHISNHRGYREFYDFDDGEIEESDEEERQNAESVQAVRELMGRGRYRTVAEMIAHDDIFSREGIPFPCYRNRDGYNKRYIMPRDEVEKEARMILTAQQQYHKAITDPFVEKIMGILFSQRDFEDGPGDAGDIRRIYHGFDGSEGACRFYREEKCGHRFTYLADEYALINILSQYRYVHAESGELLFPAEFAREVLAFAVRQGSVQLNDVKRIAKKYGLKIICRAEKKQDTPLPKAMKFLTSVKPILEGAGFDWEKLISEDAADMNSLLNRIGETLSVNITPDRRRKKLRKIMELDGHPEVIETLVRHKFSGTTNVSNKYMQGAVAAFLEGDIYGKYQDSVNRELMRETYPHRQYKLAPFQKDFDFYRNPVVMRSISEARKAINRIIEEYGSPYAVNIEVGSDLGRSFQQREEITKEQRENEKKKQKARKEIAELLQCSESEVSAAMLERYLLGEEQNWQCMYSGRPMDKQSAIRNADKRFEIDHIVPFSLVLDNTIHNKVLVYAAENQRKGQHVPLEYLVGEAGKQFRARVNSLSRKISKKKYKYLMVESAGDSDTIKEWKSRNLNDTRYISRFLVNYLKENLMFRPADEDDPRRPEVYAVKGAITSQMRRAWLNKRTWGRYDKSELKKVTYLDHAVDAIVVACCIPVYVEMTAIHQRLQRILKENGGIPNAEYDAVLSAAKAELNKYYRISLAKIEYNLTQRNCRPSLVPDLRREVDVRLQDPDLIRFFEAEQAKQENRPAHGLNETEASIRDKFRMDIMKFYCDDPSFARGLEMPFTVHVPSRKAKGKITGDNAVRIVRDGTGSFKLIRKLVDTLTIGDLNKLYTNDEDLRESLHALLNGCGEKVTIREALEKRGEAQFRTQKGIYVRRVTLRADPERTLHKQISENNYSDLPDASYYCVEVYHDREGKTRTTGISFSDIVIRDGRVRLKETYRHPENYGKHCLYLFTNDYIRILKADGTKKFEGYYRAVSNINQGAFSYERFNSPLQRGKVFTIAQKDVVEKFEIDPIGRIGGKIRCGEPLSLAKVSE